MTCGFFNLHLGRIVLTFHKVVKWLNFSFNSPFTSKNYDVASNGFSCHRSQLSIRAPRDRTVKSYSKKELYSLAMQPTKTNTVTLFQVPHSCVCLLLYTSEVVCVFIQVKGLY